MNEQLTATSILALFETNKEQRATFVDDLINRIEAGSIDPLKIHLHLKCMEDIINKLTVLDEKKNPLFARAKYYRDSLLEAASKYGAKKFDFMSASIEIKETGVKYDFGKCDDPELIMLYAKQAEIDKAVKERETLLKTVPPKGLTLTNTETGETYTVYAPSKSSTTSIAISLK